MVCLSSLKKGLFGLFCCITTTAYAFVPGDTFAPLVHAIAPSVVRVTASGIVDENEPQKVGSGFIVDENGYILSSNHLILNAEHIDVTLQNGQKLKAFLIGRDTQTDIALLKVETQEKLKPVLKADSKSVQVGDWILSFGYPYGLSQSVTAGIISALTAFPDDNTLNDFFQTDAAIVQGFSGGPLINGDGRVIGMNTSMFALSGKAAGLNFAIPSNTLWWALEQLKKDGVVKRAKLGIQTIKSDKEGVLITQIEPNSPADKAGLLQDDILLMLGQTNLNTPADLTAQLRTLPIQEGISVKIKRNGIVMNLSIRPEEEVDNVLKMPENLEGMNAH